MISPGVMMRGKPPVPQLEDVGDYGAAFCRSERPNRDLLSLRDGSLLHSGLLELTFNFLFFEILNLCFNF